MALDILKLENVKRLSGGKIQSRCPACADSGGDKKGNHLMIMPDGAYGCAVFKGDSEHNKLINKLAGTKAPADKISTDALLQEISVQIIEVDEVYPESILSNLILNHEYWNSRNISNDTLNYFKCGIALKGKMYGRACFPIYDLNGKIVGFSGRNTMLKDNPIKWKHLGKVKSWVYPYYFNKQYIKDANEVILVESIGDMLALWEAGIKNVLVLFGVTIHSSLLSTIIGINPRKIRIATNNDTKHNVGQIAAIKIANSLSLFFDQSIVELSLPTLKDFGEMSKEQILQWYGK